MPGVMRPQDERVFVEAAKTLQVWLVVRPSGPASWKYIGVPHYFPKPITCKAKTADLDAMGGAGLPRPRYETAGLVADPTIHKNLFSGSKVADGLKLWNEFKSGYLRPGPSDYKVDLDPKSRHYGCVLYKGNYLHSDYDLYDIIVVGHERANLAVVGTRDGAPDFRPARQFPVEEFINRRIGAEMVHHGGQFQFSSHTNDTVGIFSPKGDVSVEPAASWYARNFPDRKAPGPPGGFKSVMTKG